MFSVQLNGVSGKVTMNFHFINFIYDRAKIGGGAHGLVRVLEYNIHTRESCSCSDIKAVGARLFSLVK